MTRRRIALIVMSGLLLLALAAVVIVGLLQKTKVPGNGAKFVSGTETECYGTE